jgi:hypothetical protein
MQILALNLKERMKIKPEIKKLYTVSGWSWGRFWERIAAGIILIAIASHIL